MARKGIYWRLRDPATSWGDRVKLVRYAWSHDSVYIPNKNQVLLDWLTLALTGKKRVPRDESAAPWRCLCDMLRSSRCRTGKDRGRALILKAVVGQVLLDELRAHAGNGRPANCTNPDVVTSCVEAILTSRSLRHVFTNRLEMMIQLLAVSVELCLRDVANSREPKDNCISPEKTSLLDTVLDLVAETQWRRVNTQQVLQSASRYLLLSVAKFNAVVTSHDLPALHARGPKLFNFLCQALFQRDLWEHYQLYIGIKAKSAKVRVESGSGSAEVKVDSESSEVKVDSGSPAVPKDVEGVFTALESLLRSDKDEVQTLVPVLYGGFLEQYKTAGTQTGMHLLLVLTALVGVTPHHQVTASGEHFSIVSGKVRTLAALLQVAVDREVYDVTSAASPEDRQLPWLQSLGAWLLQMPYEYNDKYNCLRHLLSLDHASLEPHLTQVFATWANNQTWPAQACLLSHIVVLYGRLRRVPVMVDRCLTALRARTLTEPLNVPAQFYNSFAAAVAALPPTTAISLWQTLLTEITTHYIDGECVNGLMGVVSLLSALLLNARLVDHSVPPQVAAQVQRLVQETSDDLSEPLAERALYRYSEAHGRGDDNPETCHNTRNDLVPLLTLINALGKLRLLLAQFTALDLGKLEYWHQDLEDMTNLSPGLCFTECSAWFEELEKLKMWKGLYLFDECVILKLRIILLVYNGRKDEKSAEEGVPETADPPADRSGSEGEEEEHVDTPWDIEQRRQENIAYILKHLFKRLPRPDSINRHITWSGEVCDITADNYELAVFDLVCKHVGLIIPLCSNDQVSALARLIIAVRLGEDLTPRPTEDVTMGSVAQRLLSGAPCQELATLQSAVVLEITERLAKLVTKAGRSRSSPKHTSGSLLTALSHVHRSLYETDIGMTSQEALTSVAKHVMPLFNSLTSQISRQNKGIPEILGLLRVQVELPLEHLLPVNKATCLLQLLVLAKVGQNWRNLGGASFAQLMVLLDSPDLAPFLRTLDLGDLLMYLISTVEEGINEKTITQREDMAFILVKTATKDRTMVGQLTTFLDECHLVAKQAVEGNPIHGLEMSLVAKVLGTLRSVVERAHQDEGLKATCLSYFTRLADKTLCLLASPTFNQQTDPPAPAGTRSVADGVLKCYGHVLDHVCWVTRRRRRAHTRQKLADKGDQMEVDGEEQDPERTETSMMEGSSGESSDSEDSESSETEEEDYVSGLHKTLLQYLPTVCTALRQVLTNSQTVESLRRSPCSVIATLDTLRELLDTQLSEESAQTLKYACQNVLVPMQEILLACHTTPEITPDILDVVLTVLDTQTKMASYGQDAAAISTCLPLAGTLCTNYEALHLPADFRTNTLSLLLNILQQSDEHVAATGPRRPSQNPLVADIMAALSGDSTESYVDSKNNQPGTLTKELRVSVRQTVVAVVSSLPHDQFASNLHRLMQPLTVESLRRSPCSVIATLDTLRELLDTQLSEESAQTLKYACQNVLVPMQEILLACHTTPEITPDILDVVLTVLDTQTKMASYGQNLLSSRSISMCLHSLLYMPLGGSTALPAFTSLHQASYQLLNALLVHHERAVFAAIPPFINSAKMLMTSVVLRSDQHRSDITPETSDQLTDCALHVYRLFSLMATHKLHFTKVAAYVIADYIDHVQRVTVLPRVKKTLTLAAYSVLDLCDEHAVRLLSTTLTTSGKEVFKGLHAEYQQYHLYRGRV